MAIGPRADRVLVLLCLKGRIRNTNSNHRRVGCLHSVRRDLVREVPLTLVFRRVDVEKNPSSKVPIFLVANWDTSLRFVLKRHFLDLVEVQLCQSL